ncbi:hypothetical protein UNDKW_3541 [Undibacterium sp. KW1]|uniref:non-ribosomal peptide synthetase n=1 Tax=Undibacterium sp. KW1 TaxID=2058624 RepID=UPI001331F153|nr:amino acid adenylation domain-containing protein [Undibacterium sp. KW1]BBB61814.1 hypothetical protein UNDKW_3541 [Undibacterium sp. KW1]
MSGKLKSGFSLSPVQQRLWQLAQRDGQQTYLVSVDFHCAGVDEALLCLAFDHVLARHEILRMEFGVLPGMQLPVQAPAETLASTQIAPPQLAAIHENQRACLQKLNDSHYRLGLSALCADAQTALLILTEVEEKLADAAWCAAQHVIKFADEDLPFTSLAQWQHDMLAEPQDVQLPVWDAANSLVAGNLPDWPFMRRQRQATPYVKRQPLALSADLSATLNALAEKNQLPVAHLLYLAWAVLLYRLYPQSPAVAYQANGRAYEEMAAAMGPMARFIPLHTVINPHASFMSLLKTYSTAIDEASALQDYIAPLDSKQGLAAGFCWQQASTGKLITADAPFAWTDDCLLVLSAYADATGQLQLYVDYDMAVCDSACMHNLEEELLTLLASIVASPETQIDQLTLLGPNERQQIMHDFAGPLVPIAEPWQAPVQDILACLAKHPEQIFIQSPLTQLSGQTCSQRIAELAQHVLLARQQDETKARVVAVLLDRSVDMIASMLAIQVAGAAYLPLDTAYPEERIAFMLQDSGVSVLLTSAAIAAQFKQQAVFAGLLEKIRLITVDTLPALEDAAAPQFPVLRTTDLAYLIYTSGSTGQPKAVAVTHGALANHMQWMLRDLPLDADDAVLQKTAISFDASVWEVFAPLMAGARLVLAAPGVERDPEALLQTLQDFDISVLQLVPSMLRMMVGQPEFAKCLRLRRLCCGGEVLDAELARQVLVALPTCAECINLYGPTEATVQVVYEKVSMDDVVVAIGKPIDNTHIYVLDEYLQVQPIGVRGELHVAGASLAQGYYLREALTAERFVSDPFVHGERMCRTGDLGAWRMDGKLDCFGRADRQVKLRGYRIELGEIETIVAAQSEVLMAAVVVDRDAANIDQLLCFYTLKPGASVTVASIKEKLAAALPDYMLPNWLIPIDAFPFMPNGKVDNKALLKLRPSNTAISQAPRDTLEMRLERIWESVLHVSQVGITSNFFDLGGHSLLAVRLMAEIEKEFAHRLPLTSLFSAPTIAAQAELLRNESLQLDPVVIPIRAGNPQHTPIVLVHPTGGSVLCYRDLASGLTTDRPVIALQDPGLMGVATYTSVEELASLYLDKIAPLVKDQRYLLAGWSSGGIIAYEMARQALARGYEIAFLCLIDSQIAPLAESAPPRERLLRSISRLIAHKADIACPDLSGLPFDTALQRLLELAREADYVPPHADEKEIARLFHVFEKNVTVIGRYAAGPLPRRTLLMKATQALPEAIREAAVHYNSEEKHLGWDKLCFVKVRDIVGDHMSMMETPRVNAVVAALDQELKEVERLHGLGRQILLPMLGL